MPLRCGGRHYLHAARDRHRDRYTTYTTGLVESRHSFTRTNFETCGRPKKENPTHINFGAESRDTASKSTEKQTLAVRVRRD